MYHHDILNRKDDETVKKMYKKQTEVTTKGDWFELIKKDFAYIGEDIDEERIKSKTKQEYKKEIHEKVKNAAFRELMKLKETHSKLDDVNYTDFAIQPYLKNKMFSKDECKLLYLLRSKCHSSKQNFRRMYKNDTRCTFQCPDIEDQTHVFTQCYPIISQTTASNQIFDYDDIFGNIYQQKNIIKLFLLIDIKRQEVQEKLLPGRDNARTQEDSS